MICIWRSLQRCKGKIFDKVIWNSATCKAVVILPQTLGSVEKGASSVAMGIYASVLQSGLVHREGRKKHRDMKKVIVIGCPGSGKSTFSQALQRIIGLPLYHLDLLYWNADRTVVPKSVFRKRMHDTIGKDAWIIDGNYASTMEVRIQACDTIFFLDYPVDVCLEGVNSRKGKQRADMPWFESVDEDTDEEFISLIKNFDSESRPMILELLEKYSDKNIITFHNREEADHFFKCYQGI